MFAAGPERNELVKSRVATEKKRRGPAKKMQRITKPQLARTGESVQTHVTVQGSSGACLDTPPLTSFATDGMVASM